MRLNSGESVAWYQTGYAQQCGETYITTEGDNLYTISSRVYGDERKWSALYYANQSILGHDPGNVANGVGMRIPCLDTETAPDPTPFQRLNADLKLLSGGDYAPFTDQDLPGGGLLTELVNASFENSPSPVTFSLTWEDEWSLHLSPLLQNRVFDVGFPWFQPNCAENKEDFRCATFHFSESLFEMLIPLYYNVDNPIDFQSDSDVVGKTLCRPAGYFTHDLDRGDRRWLTDKKINFLQAETIDDCFKMLVAQEVDAVTINEFTGRLKIQMLSLQNQVKAAERPLSIEGLHVLIAKSHPRGTTFLYRFNAGLAELKKSRRYSEIIERHLSNYWTQIETPAVTESSEENNDNAANASDSSESTQSLEETETPPPSVDDNQQGEVDTENSAGSNTEEATVSSDTEVEDSQPPALTEEEVDVKNVAKQTESLETSTSAVEAESASMEDAPAANESTSDVSGTDVEVAAPDEIEANIDEVSASDSEIMPTAEPTTETPVATEINNEADGETTIPENTGTRGTNSASETVATDKTDVAAATPIDEEATDSTTTDAVSTDSDSSGTEAEATDQQASDETTIRKKRCKALPYFCRMFGLD